MAPQVEFSEPRAIKHASVLRRRLERLRVQGEKQTNRGTGRGKVTPPRQEEQAVAAPRLERWLLHERFLGKRAPRPSADKQTGDDGRRGGGTGLSAPASSASPKSLSAFPHPARAEGEGIPSGPYRDPDRARACGRTGEVFRDTPRCPPEGSVIVFNSLASISRVR